jgi:hypothetical protein
VSWDDGSTEGMIISPAMDLPKTPGVVTTENDSDRKVEEAARQDTERMRASPPHVHVPPDPYMPILLEIERVVLDVHRMVKELQERLPAK